MCRARQKIAWPLHAQVFEKGNFAGLEEMKRNKRLFNKVAPMGVNDIMMAVQYRHKQRPRLGLPVTTFDGVLDATIDRGNMEQWAQYNSGPFRNAPIEGDHYFVSTKYREVCPAMPSHVCFATHCMHARELDAESVNGLGTGGGYCLAAAAGHHRWFSWRDSWRAFLGVGICIACMHVLWLLAKQLITNKPFNTSPLPVKESRINSCKPF